MTKRGKVLAFSMGLFFVAAFFAEQALAQIKPIYRFKSVNITVKLKVEDRILEAGVYDLEFCRTSSPVMFYLRVRRGGKILGVFQGEEWPYEGGLVSRTRTSPEVPQQPTLKMGLNMDEKLLTLVCESGRTALVYPLMRARFKLPYTE